MDLGVLVEIFDKYGWWSLLGFAAIGGMYLLFTYLGKKLSGDVTDGMEKIADRMTTSISKQNDQLVATLSDQNKTLIEALVKDKTKTVEEHNSMLAERINMSEDINMKLKDIMQIHNSQRAFIIEFHNSFNNLSGIPFAKYSCTYEWFDKGLTPFANRCIGLPFSSMARIVSDILKTEDKQIVYPDMKKMEEENPTLFSMLADEERRTKAVVYTAMFDNHNTLIGLLVLEYQIEVPNNINLNALRLETAELTSILNLRYKYQSS